MSIRKNLGPRLRFLRQYKKMSQEKLSLLSGVDRSHISDIENCKIEDPRSGTVEKLAKALDVRIDQMFIWGASEPTAPYEDN
jgi:transcriptional regulator with XRE-family HTH domain